MGSVKDLEILGPAYENRSGRGRFNFSERYSIFDWGEMPDLIPGKGLALALMSAFNFERLAEKGIRSHYIGMVNYQGKAIKFTDTTDFQSLTPVMEVELSCVYKPIARKFRDDQGNVSVKYDYSFYDTNRGELNNFLIPLEIITRNGLPLGSSVFKKIGRAKALPEDEREVALQAIYKKIGVTSEPSPGDMLPAPVLMITTKLEEGDRSLSNDEAYQISGLRTEDFAGLEEMNQAVNDYVSGRAAETGLAPNWDFKTEMAWQDGLKLVDVIGTLDENRFGNTSKEFMRQWYKTNQPEFEKACAETKVSGPGWQERCSIRPIPLPAELTTLVGQMYQAACNQYTNRKVFHCPPLDIVMERLEPYRAKK